MPKKRQRTHDDGRTPGSASARWSYGADGLKWPQSRGIDAFGVWAMRVCLTLGVLLMGSYGLASAATRASAGGVVLAQQVEAQKVESPSATTPSPQQALHSPAPTNPTQPVRFLGEGARYEQEPSELGALEDDAPEWALVVRSVQSISDRAFGTTQTTPVVRAALRLTTTSCPRGPPRA